uniref:CitMHS domain-containing protein n=1 Tax=Macrostomum lignano TaxID=282301 RepID=A0A1I8F406_9PLAT
LHAIIFSEKLFTCASNVLPILGAFQIADGVTAHNCAAARYGEDAAEAEIRRATSPSATHNKQQQQRRRGRVLALVSNSFHNEIAFYSDRRSRPVRPQCATGVAGPRVVKNSRRRHTEQIYTGRFYSAQLLRSLSATAPMRMRTRRKSEVDSESGDAFKSVLVKRLLTLAFLMAAFAGSVLLRLFSQQTILWGLLTTPVANCHCRHCWRCSSLLMILLGRDSRLCLYRYITALPRPLLASPSESMPGMVSSILSRVSRICNDGTSVKNSLRAELRLDERRRSSFLRCIIASKSDTGNPAPASSALNPSNLFVHVSFTGDIVFVILLVGVAKDIGDDATAGSGLLMLLLLNRVSILSVRIVHNGRPMLARLFSLGRLEAFKIRFGVVFAIVGVLCSGSCNSPIAIRLVIFRRR